MSETASQPQEQVDTTPGTFAWNELLTSDVAGSTGFYTSLFGWTMEPVPGMEDYKMIKMGDRTVGGFLDKSTQCDGPPLWLSYVYVANLQASLAKAVELGANAFKEITEVPGMGSFAIIQDPQGGMIALWEKSQT
jgi:predicted enzyme related to lactoylglutathione lyase